MVAAGVSAMIGDFRGLRVGVIGDAILESELAGAAESLCGEAPAPVVLLSDRRDQPTGAAGVAANVRALGGQVELVSVIGDDPEAEWLAQALASHDVPADSVERAPSRRTCTRQRVTAGGQLLVRLDQGTRRTLDGSLARRVIDRAAALLDRCDAVVVCDHGYGVVGSSLVSLLGDDRYRGRTRIVESPSLAAFRPARVTAVLPAHRQALQLLGPQPIERQGLAEAVARGGARLLEATGARIAAVALDKGVVVVERGRGAHRTSSGSVEGTLARASEAFSAAFTLALAAGAHAPVAAEIASGAAAAAADTATGVCHGRELSEMLAGAGKVTDLPRLLPRLEAYRRQQRRVVFTNGCFDILHRGHITYLDRAKRLGDVLIIGVNSDESVRRLKGPSRPINSVEDRVQVLAALSSVDHLVVFDEDSPADLIRAVRPDVYVKGGDYTRETLPEAPIVEELGVELHLLPFVEDRSTTSIISRIRETEQAAGRQRRV